jgi:hypothetical protein
MKICCFIVVITLRCLLYPSFCNTVSVFAYGFKCFVCEKLKKYILRGCVYAN